MPFDGYISLGIITARGGSVGVPGKNIRPLNGKPLLHYTATAALAAKFIDRLVVSTDSDDIAAVAREIGVEAPCMRPAELARNDTPTLPVLTHMVNFLRDTENYNPDFVVLLQPTSPFVRPADIDTCIEKCAGSGADTVVTVCRAEPHPLLLQTMEGDRLKPYAGGDFKPVRRQDLPPVYRFNGAVYVVRTKVLFEQNTIFGRDMRAVEMSATDSIDIDTLDDFKLAEAILKAAE